jgi:hypothetical protein
MDTEVVSTLASRSTVHPGDEARALELMRGKFRADLARASSEVRRLTLVLEALEPLDSGATAAPAVPKESPTPMEPPPEVKKRGRGISAMTPAKVRAVRKALSEGKSQRILATQYGVTKSTIHAIANRRTWKNI